MNAWRLALQMFEEGRFNAIGTIHASCAVHYFGAEPSIERLTLPSNQLSSQELAEVVAAIREGATRPIQPGLVKAGGEDFRVERRGRAWSIAKELMTLALSVSRRARHRARAWLANSCAFVIGLALFERRWE